jgi:hypothetical protein
MSDRDPFDKGIGDSVLTNEVGFSDLIEVELIY